MLELLVVFFLLGCFVAWNIWPQPKWISGLFGKLKSAIKD